MNDRTPLMAVPGVTRGCGKRKTGGVYLESGLAGSSMNGKPLEWFLVDPPVPFEVDRKIGVELVVGPDGKTHVVDWVGQQHYPWPTDFLEEGRRFGFSRRVTRGLDFSRLEVGSRMLFVHARGVLLNLPELMPYLRESVHTLGSKHCGLAQRNEVKDSQRHVQPFTTEMCSRYWWAFPPSTHVEDGQHGVRFLRQFNELRYEVYPLAPEAPEPRWAPALIASVPVTNVGVVRAADGSHRPTFEEVRRQLRHGGLNASEADG